MKPIRLEIHSENGKFMSIDGEMLEKPSRAVANLQKAIYEVAKEIIELHLSKKFKK